jgi:hypothetical protein
MLAGVVCTVETRFSAVTITSTVGEEAELSCDEATLVCACAPRANDREKAEQPATAPIPKFPTSLKTFPPMTNDSVDPRNGRIFGEQTEYFRALGVE